MSWSIDGLVRPASLDLDSSRWSPAGCDLHPRVPVVGHLDGPAPGPRNYHSRARVAQQVRVIVADHSWRTGQRPQVGTVGRESPHRPAMVADELSADRRRADQPGEKQRAVRRKRYAAERVKVGASVGSLPRQPDPPERVLLLGA